KKEAMSPNDPSADAKNLMVRGAGSFNQVNLVSDQGGFGAKRTDENLVNAWGIAQGANGSIWISSNHKGLSVVYNEEGMDIRKPVDIPLNGTDFGSSP